MGKGVKDKQGWEIHGKMLHIIREMQIRILMGHMWPPGVCLSLKSQRSTGTGMGKLGPSHVADGIVTPYGCWGNCLEILQKVICRSTVWPRNSTLSDTPERTDHKHCNSPSSVILGSQKAETAHMCSHRPMQEKTGPSVQWESSQTWKEWGRDLKNILLSHRSQTQKAKYCTISRIREIQKRHLQRQEGDQRLPGAGKKEEQRVPAWWGQSLCPGWWKSSGEKQRWWLLSIGYVIMSNRTPDSGWRDTF